MTRLANDWMEGLYSQLEETQKAFYAKTGMDYCNLAQVCGTSDFSKRVRDAAVVPVTQGQGVINYFSETVGAVLRLAGFNAFVTKATDIAGLHEAHVRGAAIIFMADDKCFIALNTEKSLITHNDDATVLGYIAALEAMVDCDLDDDIIDKNFNDINLAGNKLTGKKVLVSGCGKLGKLALIYLEQRGAIPAAYDNDPKALDQAVNLGFPIIKTEEEIADYKLIFDTTNTGGWLTGDMLHPKALIAAPGVPLSLDEEAAKTHADRLIHDLLPIGVVSMYGLACM